MVTKAFCSFCCALMCLVSTQAQPFICKTGETSFFSEAPLENISALNKSVGAVLNPETKEIAVKMNIVDFHFPNKLMEEHFNENYMDSEKYPNSTFKGKINEDIDLKKYGTYDVSATGEFSLHGVSTQRTLSGKLTIEPGKYTLFCDFKVALKDHEIKVPKLVMRNIAEIIDVKSKLIFLPKAN